MPLEREKYIQNNQSKATSSIIDILHNKKAQDIVAFNIANIVNYTDHAIIATAFSVNHLKVLFSEIILYAKKNNINITNDSKRNYNSGWIIIDLGDCIVHLFLQQKREFYQLEQLWQIVDNG